MYRKLSAVMVIAGILCGLCALPVLAEAYESVPLSPEFLNWKPQYGNIPDRADRTSGTSRKPLGSIPDPIDLSHLLQNPPRPLTSDGQPSLDRDLPLPSSYDLRIYGRVGTIRDQYPWGSCWAFAAAASLESSYMTNYPGTSPDLSEMHLAYFVYGDQREGKSFVITDETKDILDQGGNAGQAIALFSRVGTVSESVLPYATSKTYTAPNLLPESYDLSGIRMKEAYTLGLVSGDTISTVKSLIMNNGAVRISYFAADGGESPSTANNASTIAYFYNLSGTRTNHAVTLIG